MNKLTKGGLAELRKKIIENFEDEIRISMGTCGIAAGGDIVFKAIEEELKNKGLTNIKLKKTGCLGLCFCEPNLVVKLNGMPEILYGNVDEKIAHIIVTEHVVKRNIVNNYVIFMPSKDTGKSMFGI